MATWAPSTSLLLHLLVSLLARPPLGGILSRARGSSRTYSRRVASATSMHTWTAISRRLRSSIPNGSRRCLKHQATCSVSVVPVHTPNATELLGLASSEASPVADARQRAHLASCGARSLSPSTVLDGFLVSAVATIFKAKPPCLSGHFGVAVAWRDGLLFQNQDVWKVRVGALFQFHCR